MHVVSCSHPGPEGIKKLLRSLRCNRRVRRNMMATNDQDQCTMMTPRLTLTPHEAAATDGSGTNLMHHEHAKTAAADVHGPGWIVLAPMHLPSTKSQSSCIHHERHMCRSLHVVSCASPESQQRILPWACWGQQSP